MAKDISYVLKQTGDGVYTVSKYADDAHDKDYVVTHGQCVCPGFKSRQRSGGACKHVEMVARFDPQAVKEAGVLFNGVRDEVAANIFKKVHDGVGPFVDSMQLDRMERNPNTGGITAIKIKAVHQSGSDNVVTKLTGFISGILVELRIE